MSTPSLIAMKKIEVKEWLLSDQTLEKLGEIMWQNDWKCSDYTMNKPTGCHKSTCTVAWRGLLDTHKFMKLFELFSATSWLHQKGRYPRKFEYWLWIHENQSINSLHSENYKMIVSLDAYKFYPFCSLIEITDNQILRNILHIFFLPLSVFWVTL